MSFDTETRNRLNTFVGTARALLVDEFTNQFQQDFGLDPDTGEVADLGRLSHLDESRRQTAIILRDTLAHYYANLPTKQKKQEADYKQLIERIIREQAFSILNRLCAIRMAEARDLVIESIASGTKSKGFQLYQPVIGNSLGDTGAAYQQYLLSLFDEFAVDLAVLFDRFSSQGRLFPREAVLTELLAELNHSEINHLWAEDETIGWIYQYFNSKEERKAMRDASTAPRNSRELAVRNQFFTPRYVVEFLTDNTLGRIWYEMRKGETLLKESCQYLVRRPNEIFLAEGEEAPESDSEDQEKDLTQEELLNQPVHIPHRPLKDPREIRMLDPACGSMHFGLYAFDLYLKIYEEFWDLVNADKSIAIEPTDLPPLTEAYESRDAFLRDVPRLIIEHNIHGIDIDSRAVQIAGLSLWLRAQRSWKSQDIAAGDRPEVTRSNIVCAEPMPGDQDQLAAFCQTLHPAIAQMVTAIFEEMKLAGEAGALLKIEEEISGVVAKAKEQWGKQPREKQKELFGNKAERKKQQGEFDISGITNEQFFEQAEETIYEALRKYAGETSEGGFRRKLFAGDAEKGFAFIELCRKRFDVALMNPPFGQSVAKIKKYIADNYPVSKIDLYSCFIERAVNDCTGFVGAITNRIGFFTAYLEDWRKKVLRGDGKLQLLADLGYGVLDDAMVEAAAYTIRCSQSSVETIPASFFSVLSSGDKGNKLTQQVGNLETAESYCEVKLHEFDQVPAGRMPYWVSSKWRSIFRDVETFKETTGRVVEGMTTGENERYVRLWWEVPNDELGFNSRWASFAKGGEYAPYYSDLWLVVDWQQGDGGVSVGNGAILRNKTFYGKGGLTYSERTTSNLSVRILPKGCVLSTVGLGIIPEDKEDIWYSLAVWMSKPIQFLVEMCVGSGDSSKSGTAARHYRNGILEKIPFPLASGNARKSLEADAKDSYSRLRNLDSTNETSRIFVSPLIADANGSLANLYSAHLQSIIDSTIHVNDSAFRIERALYDLLGLSEQHVAELHDEFGVPASHFSERELSGNELQELFADGLEPAIDRLALANSGARWITKCGFFAQRELELGAQAFRADLGKVANEIKSFKPDLISNKHEFGASFFQYLVGIAFGRWSIGANEYDLPDPLDELPSYSPGMSKDSTIAPELFVNDPGNQHDLIPHLQDCIRNVIVENSSETELCQMLGVEDLRTYLSEPSKFFDFHLGEYSKSRRNAPIYWPISTESGSYTLWFYYHRLTDQTLYKAVNDFVDPKLKQTLRQLADLRAIKDRSSSQEKELAQLTELESELEQFKADLLEIAAFWKPNLNDGVQITAAPLWKFFRLTKWRNKLKKTWSELESGKYDWAHLALSIWPDRVVREKCTTDRSIAIAHDLEEQLWHEVEIKGSRNTTKTEWQPRELSKEQLDTIVESVQNRRYSTSSS